MQFEQLRRTRMLPYYNLWSPLSSSKNAIVIERVFADVADVFPKISIQALSYKVKSIRVCDTDTEATKLSCEVSQRYSKANTIPNETYNLDLKPGKRQLPPVNKIFV